MGLKASDCRDTQTVFDRYQQILKIRENAVVEVEAAWGGMTSLVELEAQVNHEHLLRLEVLPQRGKSGKSWKKGRAYRQISFNAS